ncbi:DUF4373 domain-containing protein [Gracilibacillus sp. S3-1-1]|uniref:DUF4373 domain-containing protein n=1 Tax=Gracilibacillus pellucidus TaxID=3095368 RepID=A0ACC6M9G9_9BACI|nr:Lin1244/Lin1753 domain-containing protein [Gracilibacillus sp. S3-1-1]MDX8047594.1 DUF4373 domain-containing protein [Gracilibacillus sp. S3-1-1]
MARPTKEGLDYFPLDVDIDQDEKVALIEAKHGIKGFAIIVKLFMKIYKNSYYYEWGEKEQLLFAKIVDVNINVINDVINDCVKWGLFSREKFKKYNILTSKGIQERFLEATNRRKQIQMIQEYCLIAEKKLNDCNYLVIVNIHGDKLKVISNQKTQSKGKDSRVLSNKKDHNPAKFFDEHIARISPIVVEKIHAWETDLPAEVIIRAMQESVEREKRSWKYIESILKDWLNKGITTIEDAERQIQSFRKANVVQAFQQSDRRVANF